MLARRARDVVPSWVFQALAARSPTCVVWQLGALGKLVLRVAIGAQLALHQVCVLRGLSSCGRWPGPTALDNLGVLI
jgi:hypothetical protein